MRGSNFTPSHTYDAALGNDVMVPVNDGTTSAARGGFDRNAKPAESSTPLHGRARLFVVPMVVVVDVLVLGTLGAFLGYFTMALIAYGGEFRKGYYDVEAILSLPVGWAASLLSLIVFSLFQKLKAKRRTLSRSLFRSALISLGSAFVATFVLYLLLFLGSI